MSGAALAVLVALAAGAPTPPAPARWVEDQAGFLSTAAREALDAKLEGYETATGHQVVVWIGKTLGGAALDEWAVRTFAAWKVGRKGVDDGVVLFVLADDRKLDIEVGYGLEGQLPDATASRIIREVMVPKIQAGDRDGAVTAGTDAILAAIEGHPWAGASAAAPPPKREVPLAEWILGGIGVLALLIFAITHPRRALFMLGWVFSRGGFGGGGGDGGFGGGGGRSGGGGARGGW